MTRRHLIPLGLLVAVLLGVVAVAARGHPLAGGGSSVRSSSSGAADDYFYTSVAILLIAFAVIVIWALAIQPKQPVRRGRSSLWSLPVYLAGALLLGWALSSNAFLRRFRHFLESRRQAQKPGLSRQGPHTLPHEHLPPGAHVAHFRWGEAAILLALLLVALGVGAVVLLRRRRPAAGALEPDPEAAVSAALDESLDDLRSEPDLRKAIIAAYARMEHALAGAGLPRRPAEAPLEYVERALGELATSAAAIRRLTDLFEWARFSHHEPELSMRDDAVDALEAVRDELRAPAAEPVAA